MAVVRRSVVSVGLTCLVLCVGCSSHSTPSACPTPPSGGQVPKACADLFVYVKADASPNEVSDVGAALAHDASVRATSFVDQDTVWSEYSSALSSTSPGTRGHMPRELTPSVYYVELRTGTDADAARHRYEVARGVQEVISRSQLTSASSH